MNKNLSRLTALALALGISFSAAGSVGASHADQQITASYRNIRLMVNGAYYTPTDTAGNVVPLFIYNGTTYGPVRAVCEAFGYNVNFDTSTNTVIVGDKLDPRVSTVADPGKNTDEQIGIAYRDVKIKVGGQLINPTDEGGTPVEPFLYNGTTYIPVRAVANSLGQEVVWNGQKSTIQIGLQPNAIISTPTTAVPIGSSQRMLLNADGKAFIANVKISSCYTGAYAAQLMYEAGVKNRPLAGDKKYMVAKVSVTVEKTADGKPVNLTRDLFRAFNMQQEEYTYSSLTIPKPVFGGLCNEKQTLIGTVAFVVRGSDSSPRIVFGGDEKGDGGLWFRTTKG